MQEATRSSQLCVGLMVLGHGHAQTWAVPVLCMELPGRADSMACAEHSVPSFFAFCPCETLALLTLGQRSFPSPQQMSAESPLGQLWGTRGPWTGAPSLACPGSRFLPSLSLIPVSLCWNHPESFPEILMSGSPVQRA